MPKYREVFGNGRWSQLQELDNLAYAELTVPQCEECPDSALVRKRVGYRQQFTHNVLSFSYLTKYSFRYRDFKSGRFRPNFEDIPDPRLPSNPAPRRILTKVSSEWDYPFGFGRSL